jgi:hypothetical protein
LGLLLGVLECENLALAGPVKLGRARPAAASAAGSTNSSSGLAAKDLLLFRNGDRLTGTLLSIDPQNGVRWRHPDARGVIDFNPAYLATIQLPAHASTPPPTVDTCRVRLENGDELRGNVSFTGGDKVVLETAYAGRLEVPRDRVRLIAPVPAAARMIYSGPTGPDGWTFGKVAVPLLQAGTWKYSDGAFYATDAASIARDVKLPDRARVQFDLAWTGVLGALHLAVALYTDYLQPIALANRVTEPPFGEFYSLQLYGAMANLMPIQQQGPLKSLGPVTVPALGRKNYAHFDLRADKSRHQVALLVDGTLVTNWVDSEPFVGTGTAVRFVYAGGGAIRLSHLRITTWDGQLDAAPVALTNRADDLACLRNGDQVAGRLESVRNGRLTITANGAPLQIPLERVRHIELKGGQPNRPPPAPLEVRAFFADGGRVTLQLGRWEPDRVAGHSPEFGQAVFDPSVFTLVQFASSP